MWRLSRPPRLEPGQITLAHVPVHNGLRLQSSKPSKRWEGLGGF